MTYRPAGSGISARIGWYTGPREPSGCRLWTGATNARGYGVLQVEGRTHYVTRLILGLYKGDARVAMHSCDRPTCVEPSHLSIGTPKDNTQDMIKKGRYVSNFRPQPRPGESNPAAKLTEELVRFARKLLKDGWSQRRIADRLGVSQKAISWLARGVTWSHVT